MHRVTILDNFRVKWVAVMHRMPMLHGWLFTPAGLSAKIEKKRCSRVMSVDMHDMSHVQKISLNIPCMSVPCLFVQRMLDTCPCGVHSPTKVCETLRGQYSKHINILIKTEPHKMV